MCQKACAVEASLIDASILEWNSTCTATCGVSTTETGGSSSESCASNDEKKNKNDRPRSFFFAGSQFPINFEGVFTNLEKLRIEKNVGITNDLEKAHVGGHANSMGTLTAPVPCFYLSYSLSSVSMFSHGDFNGLLQLYFTGCFFAIYPDPDAVVACCIMLCRSTSRRVVSKPGSLGSFAVSEPFWMHGFDGFEVSLASVGCVGTLLLTSKGITYAVVIIVGVSGSMIPRLPATCAIATFIETNLQWLI